MAPVWTCTNPALSCANIPTSTWSIYINLPSGPSGITKDPGDPWSCTTSQQGDIKGRNSKTARTAQAAKTRKLGQRRKTRKTKNAKTTKTTEGTKTVKTGKRMENSETEETSSQLFAACSSTFCFFLFPNFLVFSVFLVFSGFLMSMHLIVLATTRKLLA